MTTITVQRPVKVGSPRATEAAAAIFGALLSWFERSEKSRENKRRKLDRAVESASVREYARRYASHDPRFAADLYAAADRHERAE